MLLSEQEPEPNVTHSWHPVARLRVALTGGFWGVRLSRARVFIVAITVAVTLAAVNRTPQKPPVKADGPLALPDQSLPEPK